MLPLSALNNYHSQTFTANFFLKMQNEKTVNMQNERTGHSQPQKLPIRFTMWETDK